MSHVSELIIEKGDAFVYYAFDVAASIDIVKAEQLISNERKKLPSQQTEK